MIKKMVGLLALVVSVSGQAANVLQVKAGQTQTLDAGRQEWVLEELVLEDGATLVVPAGASQVQIDAARVVIGKDVRIVATGAAGQAGAAGANIDGQAEKCEAGAAGGHGAHGTNGADGTTLSMTLRIAALGSLLIDTRGGAGGGGGAGGRGQDAGEFDTCNAPAGGDGGRGGDGGDGGNGGLVRVLYTLLPESGLSGGLGDRIKVSAEGGKGADGGAGGKGGEGSPGKFVNMKTLSGSKKWMAGGKPGVEGITGKPGRDGVKGQVLLQQDLRSRMDEMIQQQSQQVEALSSQMAAKLAEGQAATKASTEQGMQSLTQQVDALKVTVGALATREMVQKQGADQASQSAKLEQALKDILQRLDALEQKVSRLNKKQTSNPSATPANP